MRLQIAGQRLRVDVHATAASGGAARRLRPGPLAPRPRTGSPSGSGVDASATAARGLRPRTGSGSGSGAADGPNFVSIQPEIICETTQERLVPLLRTSLSSRATRLGSRLKVMPIFMHPHMACSVIISIYRGAAPDFTFSNIRPGRLLGGARP